jgi:nucleotide-binding universal stress UspA family protein
MHRPILCGLDDSAEALAGARLAEALAGCLEAPLVLVHAVPAVSANEGWMVLGAVPMETLYDVQDRARRSGEVLLDRVMGRLHLAGETQSLLLVGDAATALLEAAGASDAAALVVGAHGHGRIHRAVLGSVSGRVAASAPCPVIVVPHDMKADVPLTDGPVLCGVDGSEQSEHGAAVAAALAERLGRELVLVHVLASGVVLDEVARREGWALLSAIAARLGIPARLAVELEGGTVASTLSERASRERAACVVMGSRGRGPFRSAVLGSVSTEAAIQSPCPVVIVPPDARPIVDHGAVRDSAAHPV